MYIYDLLDTLTQSGLGNSQQVDMFAHKDGSKHNIYVTMKSEDNGKCVIIRQDAYLAMIAKIAEESGDDSIDDN